MAEGLPKELVEAAANLRASSPALYDVLHATLDDYLNVLCRRRFPQYVGPNEGLWALKGGVAQVQFLVDTLSPKAVNEFSAALRKQIQEGRGL